MIKIEAVEGSIADVLPQPVPSTMRSIEGAAVEALRIIRKRDAHGVVEVTGPSAKRATVTRYEGGSVGIIEIRDVRMRRNDGVRWRDEYTLHDMRHIHRRKWRLRVDEWRV